MSSTSDQLKRTHDKAERLRKELSSTESQIIFLQELQLQEQREQEEKRRAEKIEITRGEYEDQKQKIEALEKKYNDAVIAWEKKYAEWDAADSDCDDY